MAQPTTTIIFDLSEVLLTGIKAAGIVLAEKHALYDSLTHQAPYASHMTPLLIPLAEDFFHGLISEDEYLTEVLRLFPQLGSHQWLKEYIRTNFVEVEGTRDIIKQLKNKKYRLALLSVHAKEWVDYCEEKFNYHHLFDLHVYSYNTRVSKPNPQAFQGVLDALNAKPGECLFIDDSIANVKAAEMLGIKSILFTSAPELQTRLEEVLKVNLSSGH